MTDISKNKISAHTSKAAKLRQKSRYKAERRFRLFGLLAVLLAVAFLALLLITIISKALPAFSTTSVKLPIEISQQIIDPKDEGVNAYNAFDYDGLLKKSIRAQFPFASDRKSKKALSALISSGAGNLLRENIIANPQKTFQQNSWLVPLDDISDLYFKGAITQSIISTPNGVATLQEVGKTIELVSDKNDFEVIYQNIKQALLMKSNKVKTEAAEFEQILNVTKSQITEIENILKNANEEEISEEEIKKQNWQLEKLQSDLTSLAAKSNELNILANELEARAMLRGNEEKLQKDMPSLLININDGVIKVTSLLPNKIIGKIMLPLSSLDIAKANTWSLNKLATPELNRKLNDQSIVWLNELENNALIKKSFNKIFFTKGASREAEMAGILGAVVGSFLTLIITLALAFPLGVSAAIYLEEFAPKNRWTNLIEVNINNLAAVPSIVFGLLGLAVFLSLFGMPRSAPLVGGIVLALMTLPTIIIASRAALKAVPPSIREAALGIGASKLQTVFHHVLPLAMPGILTGTIIGMAQALGETAPLLMIGMVAFIVDIPGGILDPATVLPVQVFMWADFPEQAFEQKTSAAILVLLVFLILMNAFAIILRKRFERRW